MTTTLTYAIKFVADMDAAIRFHTAQPTSLHGQRIAKLRDADGAEFSVSGD